VKSKEGKVKSINNKISIIKKMNKKVKAFLYNFLGFVVIYLPTLYVVDIATHLQGIWIPMTGFMVALLVAPKFQAIKTHEGEKIFMKWLFLKGVKEVK
jgi:hypothetical protein